MKHAWKKAVTAVCSILLSVSLCSCGSSSEESDADNTFGNGKETIRILSGSENKELADVLTACAEKEDLTIEMTYRGSLDIARALEEDDIPYDAVWPASSMWISVGDVNHKIKHAESISITPVVFGIKQSKAEELGFVGREVSVKDILAAIRDGKLSFCMTSATQSNSGCCAYIGFLYALLDNPDVLTAEDLDNEEMQKELKELLSGADRSSGSSDWLKEMFLNHPGKYDAMVNYECLCIEADEELVKDNEEPLYLVYPYDGLAIADSPLGYVDHGDQDKEDAFLKMQTYLLSEEAQDAIQKTGRRTGYSGISEENKDIFNTAWGVQPDRVLSPFAMPDTEVLKKALNLYQTKLRKPSLTVYCLDYSGSMAEDGRDQLVDAMEQILIQDKAAENYLQASENEVNILIPFNEDVIDVWSAEGNGSELESLYTSVEELEAGGGTDMYAAAAEGLHQMQNYSLEDFIPAIILMTDGMSDGSLEDFMTEYDALDEDIPVFSIMFGDADESQLDAIAEETGGRVFDGREDLTAAFRAVKGYN